MRTTSDPKMHMVTVRLTEDEYNALGENKSEYIRSLIGSVGQNKRNALSAEAQAKLNDLIGMIRVSQGSADEFFIDLHERIESGEWGIRDSRLDVVGEETEEVSLPFA